MKTTSRKWRIGFSQHLLVSAALALAPTGLACAESADPLRLTPHAVSEHVHNTPPRSVVKWNNEEFAPDDGISVLMSVARDNNADSDTRVRALRSLGLLSTMLHGRACIAELISLYTTCEEAAERQAILRCLVRSRDARALPVFARELATKDDLSIRLFAAGALATWNARSGVEALVKLAESEVSLGRRTVGEEALVCLQGLSRTNTWGFDAKDVQEEINAEDIRGPESGRLWMTRFKAWFAENKERFPEWKIGDPLPKVTEEPAQRGQKAKPEKP